MADKLMYRAKKAGKGVVVFEKTNAQSE